MVEYPGRLAKCRLGECTRVRAYHNRRLRGGNSTVIRSSAPSVCPDDHVVATALASQAAAKEPFTVNLH